MNDLHASFHVRFGGEAPSPLAHRLKKNGWSLKSVDRMLHYLSGEDLARGDDTRRPEWFAHLLDPPKVGSMRCFSRIQQLDRMAGWVNADVFGVWG